MSHCVLWAPQAETRRHLSDARDAEERHISTLQRRRIVQRAACRYQPGAQGDALATEAGLPPDRKLQFTSTSVAQRSCGQAPPGSSSPYRPPDVRGSLRREGMARRVSCGDLAIRPRWQRLRASRHDKGRVAVRLTPRLTHLPRLRPAIASHPPRLRSCGAPAARQTPVS